MEDCSMRLVKRIGYLSIIFTLTAVILGFGFGVDLGSAGAQNVYAAGPQQAETVSASVVGATKLRTLANTRLQGNKPRR